MYKIYVYKHAVICLKVGDDKIIKHWNLEDEQLDPVDAVITKVYSMLLPGYFV